MGKMLIWRPNGDALQQLREGLTASGWAVDACEGMLEMLHRLGQNEYEIVVLSANPRNVELSTVLGAMKALERRPKILLNIPETEDALLFSVLSLQCPIIRGTLTADQVLGFAQAAE